MSAFSDEMAALALELLTEFGEAITVTRVTDGAYSTSTLKPATGSTANYAGFGAPTDYDNREIDGSSIKQGDVRLYVNAITVAPLPGDTITLDSVVYRAITVRKYSINSENVLYEVQIRV